MTEKHRETGDGTIEPQGLHQAGRLIDGFLEQRDWPERCRFSEEEEVSHFEKDLLVSNQRFRLSINGHEDLRTIILTVHFPFRVLDDKLADTCMLCNYINERFQYYGRIVIGDEGTLLYKDVIDLEGLVPDTAIIENMLHSAIAMLEDELDTVASVALTARDYENARMEYERKYPEQR